MGCNKDEIFLKEKVATIKKFSATDVETKQNIMFSDDESESVLFDKEKRGFYLKQMLKIEGLGNNQFRIQNFYPHDFKDVTVFFKTTDMEVPVKIMHLEKIPSLCEFVGELPLANGEVLFENKDGKVVGLKNMAYLNKGSYTLTIDCEDELLKKMSTVKHKTFIKFHNYNNGNWDATSAKRIRAYLPILANMAYLYSSSVFEKEFYNYKPVLYDNNKKPIDRVAVYRNFLAVKQQNIGVTLKVEGLGGGAAFGVHGRMLDNGAYFNPNHAWSREAWAHEYGHVLGFSHSSNMTYKGKLKEEEKTVYGYVDIVISVYKKMLESGEMPFSKNPYEKVKIKQQAVYDGKVKSYIPIRCTCGDNSNTIKN